MKRILGRLSKEIVNKYDLYDHLDKKIVLYDNDRKHCETKHASQFKDKKTFHYVMDNLEYIIENYDYVFYVKGFDKIYNKKTHIREETERYSLEYYKKLDQNITVRVRVDNSRQLKVKTVFPVDEEKLNHKIEKDVYNKYVITEEEYQKKDNQ